MQLQLCHKGLLRGHTISILKLARHVQFGVMFCAVLLLAGTLSAQNHTLILGRPTDKSVTASIMFDQNVEFYLEYGTQKGSYAKSTTTVSTKSNVPNEIDMVNLLPATRYYYRLRSKTTGSSSFASSEDYTFMTQRAPGETYRFIVEADEHLYDKKGVRSMYKITLDNQAKDTADFMLSLGDIFGDDHTPETTTSADMDALHKDYLQYLGAVCHSMPFYVCLGNHEGETGYYLKQNPPNNIAVYGTQWRKYYYPNPMPNAFYSGNTTEEAYGIGLPENYYAWTWGDALFVVLDVYRDCDVNDKPQNWDWTLGKTQYDWFKRSLETSNAKYKFVFAHHNRGQGRGGAKVAKGCEWGGYEINKNTYEFDKYRPGWGLPIHQLMVNNGVTVFFQGHDHLYAKEVLDGVVYQEVPMPSDSTYQIGMLANADAYTDITRDGTGHLRVTVAPSGVTVDFVRAYLPKDTLDGTHHNREIGYSYTAQARSSEVETAVITRDAPLTILQHGEIIDFRTTASALTRRRVEVIDMLGHTVATTSIEEGNAGCSIDARALPSGVYAVRILQAQDSFTTKMLIAR